MNALGQIFDKKTVQEQQELAKVFGEVAFKEIGDYALRMQEKATTPEEKAKWADGGEYKVFLHTVAGGLMSQLGGGSFTSGAMGAAVNEAVKKALAENFKDNPAMHQWASAVLGAAAAKVVGGNAQTGASTAASGTKNNYLTHEQYQEMLEKLNRVDQSELSPEEKAKAKTAIKAEYEKIDQEQNQKWKNENKVDVTARFDINGNLIIDGLRFEKVGVNLDGTDAYLCTGISSVTLNGRTGYTYEEVTEYTIGFGKGIKNKIDEIPEFMLNSDPQKIDAMIASIPTQLEAALHEGIGNTVVDIGGKTYEITLADWKKQYDALQTITDPEERGTKTAELLVEIGTTIIAIRAAGKAITSFSEFVSTRNIGSSKTTWTVDPAMQAADEVAGVLKNGSYIKNPTAQNINGLIKEGSNYVGNSKFNGQYMYVVDTQGNIIIGSRSGQHMPHPTLIGGSNPQVQAAGIVEIRGGKIYKIDNASGHFKPGDGSLDAAQNAFSKLPSNVFSKKFQGYVPYGE